MKFRAVHFVPVLGLLFTVSFAAQGATPREQLNQMVEQLQKSPADDALRERLIKHARTLKPAPAIPEEARRPFVRAKAAMESSPPDHGRAVELYREATTVAPWWRDPYASLAKAQELQQDYDGAVRSLKFYLLAGAPAKEARQVQDHIYLLEEKRDSRAKAADAAKRAEQQLQERQARAKRVADTLNRRYAGKRVTQMKMCQATEQGCNYDEYNSKHWQTYTLTEPFAVNFEASGDTIKFYSGGNEPVYVGSVTDSDDPNRVNWVYASDKKPFAMRFFDQSYWTVTGEVWVEDAGYDRNTRRTIATFEFR